MKHKILTYTECNFVTSRKQVGSVFKRGGIVVSSLQMDIQPQKGFASLTHLQRSVLFENRSAKAFELRWCLQPNSSTLCQIRPLKCEKT